MKIFVFIMLCVLFSSNASAFERYKAGDTLYVWATGGVNVRSKPDGEIISKLSYGTPVIARQSDQGKSSEMEIISPRTINNISHPGVNIYGEYVEVSFKNSSGYIFDGYLSKFPPFLCKDNLTNCEGFRQYFSRVFGPEKELKNVQGPEGNFVRLIYNTGITYDLTASGGWGGELIIIPDMSITEAFLFVNRVFGLDGGSEVFEVIKNTMFKNDNIRDEYIQFSGESFQISIRRVQGFIIITASGSC
jgi:hypothetical protein